MKVWTCSSWSESQGTPGNLIPGHIHGHHFYSGNFIWAWTHAVVSDEQTKEAPPPFHPLTPQDLVGKSTTTPGRHLFIKALHLGAAERRCPSSDSRIGLQDRVMSKVDEGGGFPLLSIIPWGSRNLGWTWGWRVASPSFPSFHISPLPALEHSLAPLINASANNIFSPEKTGQNEPTNLRTYAELKPRPARILIPSLGTNEWLRKWGFYWQWEPSTFWIFFGFMLLPIIGYYETCNIYNLI